jgi:hypothetical protein
MPRSPYPSTSVRECHPFLLLSCHGPSSRFPDVVVLQMYRIPAIRFPLSSCTLQSSVGQPCTGPTGKTRKNRRTDDHLLPDDTASDAVFPGQPSMTFQNVLAKTPTISPSLIRLGSTRSPNTQIMPPKKTQGRPSVAGGGLQQQVPSSEKGPYMSSRYTLSLEQPIDMVS